MNFDIFLFNRSAFASVKADYVQGLGWVIAIYVAKLTADYRDLTLRSLTYDGETLEEAAEKVASELGFAAWNAIKSDQ